ncbi:hypothetical protein HDU98_001196 [Podochytrium sp. JEL0797]|nr:hypothetical protein HDU98_001196 [Podochytrium sp. JEL0797]
MRATNSNPTPATPPTTPASIYLYETKLVPYVKDFVGQRPDSLEAITIKSNTIDEFKTRLFHAVKHHLVRTVDVVAAVPPSTEPTYKWNEIETVDITVSHLSNYVSFINKSDNRAASSLDSIDTNKLVGWKSKDIHLYIAKYSNNIASSKAFAAVRKTLIIPHETDRAGAASVNIQNELTSRLRQIHEFRYVSQDINWQVWSNWILSSEPHMAETRTNSAPPQHLIHLFALAAGNEGVRNQDIRNANRVAIGENRRVGAELRELKRTFDAMLGLMGDLGRRLGAAITSNSTRAEVLHDMLHAVNPTEDPESAAIFARVTNQDDVDHAGL